MIVDNFEADLERVAPNPLIFIFILFIPLIVKFKRIVFFFIFLFAGISCSYVVSAVRYLAQETYIGGKDVKQRLTSAAFAGFGVYRISNPTNALIERPVVSVVSARVDENNKYLESQVESCEEILFVSNATGMDITNQVIAGLLCNLGPGKKPSEL